MTNIERILDEVSELSPSDQWQVVHHLLRSLELKQEANVSGSDWHARLNELYGALADDPLERPEQLPLEDREWFE